MAEQISPQLSVVINTKNAAGSLKATLKSITGIADEIIVMDMKSKDDTVAIAKSFGARVFSHPDVGYVEPARNAALAKAKGDWILLLDADEVAPSALLKAIPKLIANEKVDAYFLPRKNFIFGKWVHTGWWPDYILRLFRQGKVTWSDELHAVPQVEGTLERLNAKEDLALVHQNYQTVTEFLNRGQRYAGIEASAAEVKDNKAVLDPTGAFFNELLSRYYARDGMQDGEHGLYLSFLQAAMKLETESLRWESRAFPGKKVPLSLSQRLEDYASDARYWEAHQHAIHSRGLKSLWWKLRARLRV